MGPDASRDKSGDQAVWRDLVARLELPSPVDAAHAPWPDRENLGPAPVIQGPDAGAVAPPPNAPGADPAASEPPAEQPPGTGRAAVESGPAQQGTAPPETAPPGTAPPGTAEPGTTPPGTAQRGTAEPETAELGTAKPVTGQPGTGEPGQPAAERDGAGQPGASSQARRPRVIRPASFLGGAKSTDDRPAGQDGPAPGQESEPPAGSGLSFLDFLDEQDNQDDRYVPPPVPPLPKLDPVAKGAWLALFGGPGYLLVATMLSWQMPGWAELLAVAAFITGFVVLVSRLGDGPSRRDGPDQGAVI